MSKVKKYTNLKKGFTLIEVIISIAILAIASTALVTMFTNGFNGICGAGKKSVSHYTSQEQIESNIEDSSNLPGTTTNTENYIMTLEFPSKTYSIVGRKVDVTYNYGGRTKKLTTFTTNE